MIGNNPQEVEYFCEDCRWYSDRFCMKHEENIPPWGWCDSLELLDFSEDEPELEREP